MPFGPVLCCVVVHLNFLLNILDSCTGVKPPQRKLDSIANFIKSYEADFGPFKDILKNGILLRERLDIDAEALVHGQGLTEASSGILTVSHTKEHVHDDEKKKQHEELHVLYLQTFGKQRNITK